jgi:hypothetical protein
MDMKIGIFFFLDGKVMMDAVPVVMGKSVGDAIQYGNHFEFWKSLQPKTSTEQSFKEWPYYSFPRGKVVYVPGKQVFRIYSDSCLNDKDIESVTKYFGLDDSMVQIDNDNLYQCAKCNEYFDLAIR